MRMVTGAILLLAAEQAFAHTQLVRFPNHQFTRDVLYPASSVLGIAFLIWGALVDARASSSESAHEAAAVAGEPADGQP
ncbi:hypothetical protein GC176_25510 [bacterium]|nr:hypothetical protein [bacterium]